MDAYEFPEFHEAKRSGTSVFLLTSVEMSRVQGIRTIICRSNCKGHHKKYIYAWRRAPLKSQHRCYVYELYAGPGPFTCN